jgi:hypothetical protein
MIDVFGRRGFRPRSRGLIGHMLSVPIHSKSWKRCGRTNPRLLPCRHFCIGRTSLSGTGSLGRREDHIVLLHVFLFVQREEHHGKLLVAFSQIRGPYRCGVSEVRICRTHGKNMEFELELPFFSRFFESQFPAFHISKGIQISFGTSALDPACQLLFALLNMKMTPKNDFHMRYHISKFAGRHM